MPFSSLVSQNLQRVEVLQPQHVSSGGAGDQLHAGKLACYGAVALFFDRSAVVLRSKLRHGRPSLREAMGNERSGFLALTLCSHEEGQWLMQATGTSWRPVPTNRGKATCIHWTGEKLIVELASSELVVISYREDLDAAWLIDGDGCDPAIAAIELATPDDAFGWLLPDSPYRIFWDGHDWQQLALLWACLEKRQAEEARGKLFRNLYALRLRQHPNLFRRFAVLRYPIHFQAKPWLAGQIEQIRLTGLSEVTNSDQDWLV